MNIKKVFFLILIIHNLYGTFCLQEQCSHFQVFENNTFFKYRSQYFSITFESYARESLKVHFLDFNTPG
jgi:hypothetical protein